MECLRGGWATMRKEISWNAGMHSHPGFLNKPSMNEAAAVAHAHTHVDHLRSE